MIFTETFCLILISILMIASLAALYISNPQPIKESIMISNLLSFLQLIARKTINTMEPNELHAPSTGDWCLKYAELTKQTSNTHVPMI